ncbi:MAG: glycosyltransferase family 2 protein [Anaerolineales bacterium]|nr:glycosyltransferase family 2 protein [Anaerolineales bacterium]
MPDPVRPPVPRISVLMPTYNHAAFIRRALDSLCGQTLADWELILVDDGATDATAEIVAPYLADGRIHYHRLPHNQGRGAALNHALDRARAPYVAYLPSDDLYYPEHLAALLACLEANPNAVLAFSGVRYHYNRHTTGQIPLPRHSLQMVQVLHRRTADRWLTRAELVTDDLERMFWHRLRPHGDFVGTDRLTCEWVAHPQQLHKLLQEPIGGINTYRSHFNVPHPLRFHTTEGNFMDEVAHYGRFRHRPPTPPAADGLKILLVGELAYNPERILALEERGHRLYGLWMPKPYWYNTVGPLPFGHVEDLPRDDWQTAVRRLQPDVIYGLLNWQAVPFVLQVRRACPDIPFIWHFKEGPFICLEHGIWSELEALHRRADGQIFSSPEMRAWYETAMPGVTRGCPTHVLDGDLPKQDWFAGIPRTPRLSAADGELHTVVPGRPIGLHPPDVAALAAHGIHLHFYGDFTHGQWRGWIEKTRRLAPRHLHLHAQVDQDGWVREFSQYDAGWLHWQKSHNGGDIGRADWDDLNYPARIATLMAAGLPLLQYDNAGACVATQALARRHDVGLFFSSIPELRAQLDDRPRLAQLQENAWRNRSHFTFDHHADDLLAFMRQVIEVAT